MARSKIFLLLFFPIILATIVSAAYTWTGNEINYTATEDIVYYHNLTNNVTGTGEDRLFSIDDTGDTKILWDNVIVPYSTISSFIKITNSTLGILEINSTRDNETGMFRIPLKVSWGTSDAVITSFYFRHDD